MKNIKSQEDEPPSEDVETPIKESSITPLKHRKKSNGSDITSRTRNAASDNTSSETNLLKKTKSKILKLFGIKGSTLEEDFVELIEEHDPEGKQVGSEERTMLANVLQLGDLKVEDVMVPRSDIIAIEDTISLSQLKAVALSKEHTRMPVYKGNMDNITGFIHIKDLIPFFGTRKSFSVSKVLREILFVPPSMKTIDLLIKMRDERLHVAIVLDEYGGTDGLVTMEDLVEEIVGEIEDEHDEATQPLFIKRNDNEYEASARVTIEELEHEFNFTIGNDDEKEEYGTIGGLIFYLLGKVPEKGEIINHPSGLEFKVLDSDPRRIKKLLIRLT